MKHDEEALRVLIISDNPSILATLRGLIGLEPDLEVIGESGYVDDLLEVASIRQTDVVVLDLSDSPDAVLPQIQCVRTEFPEVHVVALSRFLNPELAEQILRAGALGYIAVPEETSSLAEAIRSVAGEQAFVSRRVAGKLLSRIVQACTDEGPSDAGRDGAEELGPAGNG